jgi:hypothetical protein
MEKVKREELDPPSPSCSVSPLSEFEREGGWCEEEREADGRRRKREREAGEKMRRGRRERG